MMFERNLLSGLNHSTYTTGLESTLTYWALSSNKKDI